VPFRGGAGELDDAWPGHGLPFTKDDSQPGDEAGLRVADLDQASKEGVVAIGVVSLHVVGEPLYCEAPADGRVAAHRAHKIGPGLIICRHHHDMCPRCGHAEPGKQHVDPPNGTRINTC
jgi:hypothetical protein